MRDSPLAGLSSAAPGAERMSPVDTAWLRMEELSNQMTITAVMEFEAPLAMADLRRVMRERFLRFDRFRQRVRRGRAYRRPVWEEDPDFDLDRHLETERLPAPAGKEELQALVSRLMSRPLDFAHPLWRFHLVENYDGGAAIVARFHHCIADGYTLVRVVLSLTDRTPDAPPGSAPSDDLAGAFPTQHGNNPAPSPSASVAERVAAALRAVGRGGTRTAELVARGVGVLGKLAWPTRDPDTSLRGPLGQEKRATWSAPIPLEEVKAVGKALGGTVNDVLMTAATGALRRHLREHGEDTEGLDLRAAVPVNLRRGAETPPVMGNGFGLIFLALPVGVADPAERFDVLHRRMDRLKRSPEAAVLLGILSLLGLTTRTVEDLVVTYLARKVTAVATNVPGPQETLYLAGAPMKTLMAWVPQAGRVGLGISIISYDGNVRLGLATDAGIVADPEPIVAHFQREFEALRALASGRAGGAPAAEPPPAGTAPEEAVEEKAAEEAGTPGEAAPPPPAAQATPERCQATTKAGTQCKLPAQEGIRYCHVHREDEG